MGFVFVDFDFFRFWRFKTIVESTFEQKRDKFDIIFPQWQSGRFNRIKDPDLGPDMFHLHG